MCKAPSTESRGLGGKFDTGGGTIALERSSGSTSTTTGFAVPASVSIGTGDIDKARFLPTDNGGSEGVGSLG